MEEKNQMTLFTGVKNNMYCSIEATTDEAKKQFTKFFKCEKEMNNFLNNKCKYSKKLIVIEDSRDLYYGFD